MNIHWFGEVLVVRSQASPPSPSFILLAMSFLNLFGSLPAAISILSPFLISLASVPRPFSTFPHASFLSSSNPSHSSIQCSIALDRWPDGGLRLATGLPRTRQR